MYNTQTNTVGVVDACSSGHAVSWCAIIAGAIVAMSVSLALLMLGSSFGFAIASPWSANGATALTVHAAIWLIIMQWFASGLGGYITGRLRSQWLSTHAHEVFFRDTAHGFIMWSVATLVTVGFLASAASSVISGGAQVAAAGAGASAAVASMDETKGNLGGLLNPVDYYVDGLYRAPTIATDPANDAAIRKESARLIGNYIVTGEMDEDDKVQLSQLVAIRTGLTPAEVVERVDAVTAKIDAAKEDAKEKADDARKVAASVSLYTFLSFLIGAFIASVAAVIGGRRRDYIYV